MNVARNVPDPSLIQKEGESVTPVVNIEDLEALWTYPVVGGIDILHTNSDDQGRRIEIEPTLLKW